MEIKKTLDPVDTDEGRMPRVANSNYEGESSFIVLLKIFTIGQNYCNKYLVNKPVTAEK